MSKNRSRTVSRLRNKNAQHLRKQSNRASTRPPPTGLNGKASPNKLTGDWGLYRMPNPFPLRFETDLSYEAHATFSVGALGIFGSESVFSLNSPYDPNVALGGTQPMGFQACAAIWNNYKVHDVSIIVEAVAPTSDGIYVGAQIECSSSSFTLAGSTFDVGAQCPRCCVKRVNTDSSSRPTRMTRKFNIGFIEGLTPIQFSADDGFYVASVGSNPSNQPTLRVAVGSPIPAAGSATVSVRIVYHVQFYNIYGYFA